MENGTTPTTELDKNLPEITTKYFRIIMDSLVGDIKELENNHEKIIPLLSGVTNGYFAVIQTIFDGFINADKTSNSVIGLDISVAILENIIYLSNITKEKIGLERYADAMTRTSPAFKEFQINPNDKV